MTLQVDIFTGAFGLRSASPFCLKLLAWFELADVPYEVNVVTGAPKTRTGKLPGVRLDDGRMLSDSSHIIDTLTRELGIQLDAHLSPEAHAQGILMQRLCEEHLYCVMVYERWLDPEGWKHTRPAYFRGLPAPLRAFVPELLRRSVRKSLHGQGIGRLTADDIAERGRVDLAALAALLKTWTYAVADSPSRFDATLWAFLASISHGTHDGPLKRAFTSHPALADYVHRVQPKFERLVRSE